MAVLPMKRVMILGMKKDRKAILESLQRLQTVEIEKDLAVSADDPVFSCADTSEPRALFDKNATLASNALETLNKYSPEKSSLADSLNGRKVLSKTEYEKNVSRRDTILDIAKRINKLEKEIVDATAEIPRTETQIEALMPWMKMDLPLDFKGTKKSRAFIGSFPGPMNEATIVSTIESSAPDITGVDVTIISSSDDITCVMIVCLKKDADAVEESLRRMNFARAPVSNAIPADEIRRLNAHMSDERANIQKYKGQIISYAGSRKDLKFLIDYFTMRYEKYEILSKLTLSKRTFILKGWIPAADAASLEKVMSRFEDCIVEFKDCTESDDSPVLLLNNGFSAPVEGVVENYSLPGKGEIDPTVPVSCFYYILFGMMLSDAGYGLIMALGCGIILSKFKQMEAGLKKSLTMFFYCGLGTMLSGVLFGSYFGDLPTVVAKTFFGVDFTIPCWINPLESPLQMLLLSFCIGIVHLFAGLALLLYTDIKNGKIADAFYDVIFWYMLVGGLITYGITQSIVYGIVGLTGPVGNETTAQIGAIVACIGAVGIILTGGRESRNPVKRLLKGLYALYGVTNYLSDLLSYSRLLALGLATSVISQVFNQLASMTAVGTGFIGVILFIVIAVVGHSLNFAINALGAYVHSNRLTFVEFFGKFFNGGGRKFLPFSMNTKYIKVKEEI